MSLSLPKSLNNNYMISPISYAIEEEDEDQENDADFELEND